MLFILCCDLVVVVRIGCLVNPESYASGGCDPWQV